MSENNVARRALTEMYHNWKPPYVDYGVEHAKHCRVMWREICFSVMVDIIGPLVEVPSMEFDADDNRLIVYMTWSGTATMTAQQIAERLGDYLDDMEFTVRVIEETSTFSTGDGADLTESTTESKI